MHTGDLTQANFETNQGELRSFGTQTQYTHIADYKFTSFKQMSGFGSYEVDGGIKAFGPFDAICNHFPRDYYDQVTGEGGEGVGPDGTGSGAEGSFGGIGEDETEEMEP